MRSPLFNRLTQWQPIGLCLVSGLCFCLGWPPYPCTPLLFVAFVPLLILAEKLHLSNVDRKERLHFYAYTYLTLVLWNLGTNWWICKATVVGGLFAVFYNAAWMSWPICFFYNRWLLGGCLGSSIPLLAAWLCMERWHLGGHLSFPWLNLGNGLACRTRWAQWYAYTGTLGGTLWILGTNLCLFQLCFTQAVRSFKRTLVLAIVWVVGPMCISYALYYGYTPCGQPTEVVVAQLGLDPYTRAYPETPHLAFSDDQLTRQLCSLSAQAVTEETEFLVWPESTLNQSLNEAMFDYSSALSGVRSFLRTYPALSLLIGARTHKTYGGEKATPSAWLNPEGFYCDIFNTVVFLGNGSRVPQVYHKSKLVPGAEETPFLFVIRWLHGWQWLSQKLAPYNLLASPGVQPKPTVFFNDQNVGIAPIVCYESIYGAHTAQFVRAGASLIAISTIDGWWGNTPGHQQHFHYARLRAIENRRCVARSAFEGISGFIDQRGDVISMATYGQRTCLRQHLLASTDVTFYTKHGDYLATGALVCLIVISCLHILRGNVSRSHLD